MANVPQINNTQGLPASSTVFWDNDPSIAPLGNQGGVLGSWDQVSLNSTVLPGLGFPIVSPKRKTDTRSPKQKHHGSIFDLGHEITEFTLKLRIWTDSQWAEWNRIRKGIDPTEINDDKKREFSIGHPSLKDCNVNQVYLNERSNWQTVGGEGGGVKETVFKGFVIHKPVASGPEKVGPTPQLTLPGNVYENLEPPLAPSAQGIYPADPR